MDPHSTHSQFNQKTPRSRTRALDSKFIDPMAHSKLKPVITPKPSKRKTDLSASSLVLTRPIATNSRIKQDEKYKKSMYLSFVNNALQEKINGVKEPFDELVDQFNLKSGPGANVGQLVQLRYWLLALSHVVSRLERTHSPLIHAIVNMPWTMLDSVIVKSYIVFMGMLISARPEYLSLVLGKISQGFTHQFGIQALEAGMPEGSSSPLTKRIIYDRLHDLLRHLLSLIPTLPSTLQPHLVRNFPHKRQNQVAHSTYIRNLLRISVYCPELADKILATIVERAIQMDVEIQVEVEELDDAGQTGSEEVFELDPFDTVVGQDADDSGSETGSDDGGEDEDGISDLSSDAGDVDDDARAPELPTNFTYIQDMVKKLDSILTLVFDHFHRNYTSITTSGTLQAPPPLPDLPPIDGFSSSPPSPLASPSISTPSVTVFRHLSLSSSVPSTPTQQNEEPLSPQMIEQRKSLLRSQFHTLLSIFDRTILRTFKSRYTQFLLFWYTSLDPEFADIFQGMLVERALLADTATLSHNGTSPVTRSAAASYIGSFVSRATFVDREDTQRIVGLLCDFLGAHLDSVEELLHDGALGSGGMAQHAVFYAVAQAAFLIFCFRWRDLQEDEDLERDHEFLIGNSDKGRKKWIPQLRGLQRVVNSVLNPLRVCSANVVAQFAQIAHATDFLYCYTILENNKRSEYGANTTRGRSPSQTSGTLLHPALLDEVANPELNTFFPFDPYRLSKSNAYIQGIYREWSTVAIGDDDNDQEDEEDGEGNAEGYMRFLTVPSSDAPDESVLGKSLGAMSISPA